VTSVAVCDSVLISMEKLFLFTDVILVFPSCSLMSLKLLVAAANFDFASVLISSVAPLMC
jgi:hypothetical protein